MQTPADPYAEASPRAAGSVAWRTARGIFGARCRWMPRGAAPFQCSRALFVLSLQTSTTRASPLPVTCQQQGTKCGYRCVQYESIFGLAYGFAVVRHFYKPWCGTFDRIDIAQAVNKEQITKQSDRARSWAHRKFLLVTMLG